MQRFVSSLALTSCLWGAADFPYLAPIPAVQAQLSPLAVTHSVCPRVSCLYPSCNLASQMSPVLSAGG